MVGFDSLGMIRFLLFWEQRMMLNMKFTLLSRIYDPDVITTPQYKQFLINFLPSVTMKGVWLCLSHGRSHELSLNKASFFTSLALRYLDVIIAPSFVGRADSTTEVEQQ